MQKCERHDIKLECMGGRSAHPSNWYCPECDKEAATNTASAEVADQNERLVISPNWSRHRKRWLDRINTAEKKARHIENEVHLVLDDIDEGKADLEHVRKLLLRAVRYAEGL